MKYRNNKTGGIYELVGLVVDSNNDTPGPDEAEILYRSADDHRLEDAVHYRRTKAEFQEKFTVIPAS